MMRLRKLALAGLMAATILSGTAPAHAQQAEGERNWRTVRGGGAQAQPEQHGQRPGAWQRQSGGQASQPRPPMQRGRVQAAQQPQPGDQRPNYRQQDYRQARAVEAARQDTARRAQWQAQRSTDAERGRAGQDRRDDRRDVRIDRRDDRNIRVDQRDDRRGGARRDADRRDWNRNDGDRRNGWDRRSNWNDGRRDRIDDRRRWDNQRRWDSNWRNDRRYDWQDYRARYRSIYRPGRYYAPRGWSYGYRSFSIGFYLDSMLYSRSYWLDDPYRYRLPPAYGNLRWIRYYDDALLIDIRDGYVVDVIRDFFW